MPSKDIMDPNFKRVMYVRYADDFVILAIGNMADCFTLRRKVKDFLMNKLGLELNVEKTNVSSLKQGFEFLGAELIHRGKVITKIRRPAGCSTTNIRRRSTRILSILAPIVKMIDKLINMGFAGRNHLAMVNAKGRKDLVNLSHFEIIAFYNARIKGILNYYSFAGNFDKIRKII